VEALDRVTTGPGRGSTLALFDLDGFKSYNDTFGHPAGDALLQRLGHKLERVLPDGAQAFRMGGDEFCVLVPAGPVPADEVGRLCSLALAEEGDGFRITSSFGVVAIPDETVDPAHALGIADERLYAAKASRRSSPGVQSSAVLLAALGIRDPDLLQHLDGTGGLAEAVARHLGLSSEEVADVRIAAELHDVGKLGIPDAILRKEGPLDEEEWAYMRRHTIIGERILMAAPALRRVARLVRSSHERWDGHGYPDKTPGGEIPCAARIFAVADALDALTTNRPYRAAASLAEARDVIAAEGGAQFDPAITAALHALPDDALLGLRRAHSR
jgi:diguanylate cyclase (GGDEF)-like protein